MGDRANVYIKESKDRGVYLYTHWGGSELAAVVRGSLKRGESRWSDSPYLARIIFADMIDGDEKELTGFGISSGLCDNEHPIIVVDADEGRIGFAHEPDAGAAPEVVHWWPFADFVALSPEALEAAWVNDDVAVEG